MTDDQLVEKVAQELEFFMPDHPNGDEIISARNAARIAIKIVRDVNAEEKRPLNLARLLTSY